LDHPFFEGLLDKFHLSGPEFDFDSQIAPLTILNLLYPEDLRDGQNDGFVLLIHSIGNGLNPLGDFILIQALGQLNIDVGPDTAAAKLADDANISVGD